MGEITGWQGERERERERLWVNKYVNFHLTLTHTVYLIKRTKMQKKGSEKEREIGM